MADLVRLVHSDVAIVGAGVPGLAMACALGRAGFSVNVFDGAIRPTLKEFGTEIEEWDIRVSALTPASVGFLEELGVWNQISRARRVAPFTSMHVWDESGTGRIHFTSSDIGAASLGQVVENRIAQRALLDCAEAFPGIEIHWESALAELQRIDSDRTAVFANGIVAKASLIIGADGARSRIRDLEAIATRQWTYFQSAIVAAVSLSESHQSACWQAFLPAGPVALLPLADPHMAALVWSLDEADHRVIAAFSDEQFIAALNHAMESPAPKAQAIGPRASFPLRQCHAVDYVKEGLALVADAAHSIHPLAGQGMNLGLADVEVLSQELREAKSTGLAVSSLVPLQRYQRRRKTDNLAMMVAMEGFKRGFGSLHPGAVLTRNIGLNFVDKHNWIKRWFMRKALG